MAHAGAGAADDADDDVNSVAVESVARAAQGVNCIPCRTKALTYGEEARPRCLPLGSHIIPEPVATLDAPLFPEILFPLRFPSLFPGTPEFPEALVFPVTVEQG